MSESWGKALEFIPILEDPGARTVMLPPAVWHLPNDMMGFLPDHVLGWPFTVLSHETLTIPGSNTNRTSRLRWIIRILEDHDPARLSTVPVGHIDAAAVVDMIEVLRVNGAIK